MERIRNDEKKAVREVSLSFFVQKNECLWYNRLYFPAFYKK